MVSDTDTQAPTLLADEQVSVQSSFLAVGLSDVEDYLMISHSQDSSMIADLIRTAMEQFEAHTSHYLEEQTRRAVFAPRPTHIRLPAQPVSSLDKVETVDEGSATQESASDWYLMGTSPPEVRLKGSGSVSSGEWQEIRFEYTSGYSSANDVPHSIQTVLKKMVSDLYEYRTTKGEGLNRTLSEQPFPWKDMLAPHKTPYYSQPEGKTDSFFL